MSVFSFLSRTMQNGMTSNPSARRTAYMSWQGWGGLGFLFGLGFATALLFGFDQADRLTYFKETLSFLLYLFGAGVAASGFTYGAIQIADKKFSSTAPTEEDKA